MIKASALLLFGLALLATAVATDNGDDNNLDKMRDGGTRVMYDKYDLQDFDEENTFLLDEDRDLGGRGGRRRRGGHKKRHRGRGRSRSSSESTDSTYSTYSTDSTSTESSSTSSARSSSRSYYRPRPRCSKSGCRRGGYRGCSKSGCRRGGYHGGCSKSGCRYGGYGGYRGCSKSGCRYYSH